jgi:hypothetical protein
VNNLEVVIKLGDKVDSGIGLPRVNVLESTYGEVIVIVKTLYICKVYYLLMNLLFKSAGRDDFDAVNIYYEGI